MGDRDVDKHGGAQYNPFMPSQLLQTVEQGTERQRKSSITLQAANCQSE